MSGVRFPDGYRFERLAKSHPRKAFASGQTEVDNWLRTNALQNQDKRLSVTKVLLDDAGAIAGYFTLASRLLPVAVLAWLGVAASHQKQGLGAALLAQALRDCHAAGQTFAFIAVILDCVNDAAKAFYQKFDFAELPGHPYRLLLSAAQLELMVNGT